MVQVTKFKKYKSWNLCVVIVLSCPLMSYWESQSEGSSKQLLIKSRARDLYFLKFFTCTITFCNILKPFLWEVNVVPSHKKWISRPLTISTTKFLFKNWSMYTCTYICLANSLKSLFSNFFDCCWKHLVQLAYNFGAKIQTHTGGSRLARFLGLGKIRLSKDCTMAEMTSKKVSF